MPSESTNRLSGSCLCGAVSLAMIPDRPVVACHCKQCRKQTGHFVAATRTANDQLTVSGADNITWYASSDSAERGFCRHCGSVLFWRSKDSTRTSVMAGCLEAPTGLVVERHIYTRDKGDYYQIDPEALCFPQSD
ncbi:MAG: GFA family protein [Granulosicoccus sp.]